MDSRQAYNAKRNAVPWRKWYKLQRWRDRRAAQLAAHPMCVMCKARGVDRPASVANHIKRHEGDYELFWFGQLNSLCKSCHDVDQQRIELGGKARPMVGADGWPIE
jgi:5-methylcytosine-specific restriction protein A